MKKETWTKICSFLEKHEKIIFGVIIVLFAFMFYLSYMIHNIPYTVGWGNSYADLMIEGKMPYRDFYYYLPPLNLLIDIILWKLSFKNTCIANGISTNDNKITAFIFCTNSSFSCRSLL